MSYAIFIPPIQPQSVDDTLTELATENSFGDGYEQNVQLGLHPLSCERSISWPVLTSVQFSEIITFFRNNAGKPFIWSVAGESSRKWRCKSCQPTIDRNMYSISATLMEVFV